MIILTTLGTGPYSEARYEWNGRSHQSTLLAAALATWFPEAKVKALATKEATAAKWDELRAAVPRAELVQIPTGSAEAELWQIFNTVTETLPADSTVIFDITHGYRSQPVLTLLALAFLRIARGITLEHVVYGAYERERPKEEPTPVYDLTPFVTMLDWANAADRFLDTGDAREIAKRIPRARGNPLNDIVRHVDKLSESLALMRGEAVLRSAEQLAGSIGAARMATWDVQHAPLRLLLDRIEAGFAPMGQSDPLRAQWEQIRWLAAQGHEPAAASLAREWLVNLRILNTGQPILPVNNEIRDKSETWLNDRTKNVPPEWEEAQRLWINIADLRNDLMHYGMRESAKKPATIKSNVQSLPEALRLAAAALGIEVGP